MDRYVQCTYKFMQIHSHCSVLMPIKTTAKNMACLKRKWCRRSDMKSEFLCFGFFDSLLLSQTFLVLLQPSGFCSWLQLFNISFLVWVYPASPVFSVFSCWVFRCAASFLSCVSFPISPECAHNPGLSFVLCRSLCYSPFVFLSFVFFCGLVLLFLLDLCASWIFFISNKGQFSHSPILPESLHFAPYSLDCNTQRTVWIHKWCTSIDHSQFGAPLSQLTGFKQQQQRWIPLVCKLDAFQQLAVQ